MSTKEYKTLSETIMRANPAADDKWVLGLDIGYSSVKGFSPNSFFCFPSYARKVPEDRFALKDTQMTDIKYRETRGDTIWVVGKLAYDDVIASDVMDSDSELFGRNRYFSPMFQVIARCGMAMGLLGNHFGNPGRKKILVQTGLPSRYFRTDAPLIKEALSGRHEFEIKIGMNPWTKFVFDLSEDDISVIPQPLGALFSASTSFDGKRLPTMKEYFNKNVLVFDPGFGTLDTYVIKHGAVVSYDTFPEYGMREVFARTCADIAREFRTDVTIPDLQNRLDDGMIRSVDRRLMKSKNNDFSPFLEKNSKDVCYEAVEKLKVSYNYFADIDYIIAVGGTYEAWKNDFDAVFKDMDGLTIVPGNINDPQMSNIFSNVRGYYFYKNGWKK